MKWIKTSAALLAASLIASSSFAQEETPPPAPKPPKESKEKHEEIIIRKKDGKEEKMTIVVDGDNVTINGKPMDDFKDGNVKIIKREKRMGGGDNAPHVRTFMAPHPGMDMKDFEDFTPSGINKAMLGVMTAKADGGVKVTEVTPKSGAEKAGLQKEDVITKVGTTKISDTKDLTEAIGKYKVDDKVDITYNRNGKESKATATLTENKGMKKVMMKINGEDFDFDMPGGMEASGMEGFNFNFDHKKPKLGLQIQDMEEGKGVKVKDVDEDSPSAKAGLKEGDVITQINGKDIDGVDDLRSQTKELKEGNTLKLSYKRDGKSQTADLKIPKRLKTADL